MKEYVLDMLLGNPVSRYMLRSVRNIFLPKISDSNALAISIEVSSLCNAKCIFCNYRKNYRAKKLMSVQDFEIIARTCVGIGYENLNLTCLTGEFFTHPHATEIIRISKAVGFKHVGLFTNAIALSEHDLHSILGGDLDAMLISFPGFSKKAYEEVFGVRRYESFIASIKKLLKIHKETDSNTVIVFEPRTYLTSDEIEHSDFYLDFITGYLSDKVLVRKPIRVFDTWGGTITKDDLLPGMRLDRCSIKSIWPLKKTYLCEQILSYGILSNGDVRLCNCRCDDNVGTDKDSLLLGNLNDYTDFAEFIEKNQNKTNKIRSEFIMGKLPELCIKCPFYYPVKVLENQ
jgi:MoaA/NifB/PqqE/SkfB family radical SAM enzyme